MSTRPLHFSAFIWPNGYHESAWRVVRDDVRGVLGLPYYADMARIAERGLMDAIFLADNIAIAEWYDPALTTVDQPHYQMGERAMQAVLNRLEKPSDPAEALKFETSLIIRRSSGAPRKP